MTLFILFLLLNKKFQTSVADSSSPSGDQQASAGPVLKYNRKKQIHFLFSSQFSSFFESVPIRGVSTLTANYGQSVPSNIIAPTCTFLTKDEIRL